MSTRISKQAIELWLKQNPGQQWTPPELSRAMGIDLGSDDIRAQILSEPELLDAKTIQKLFDYGYTLNDQGKFDFSKPPQHDFTHSQQEAPPSVVSAATTTTKRVIPLTMSKAIPLYLTARSVNTLSKNKMRKSSSAQYKGNLNKFCEWLKTDHLVHEAAKKAVKFLEYEFNETDLRGSGRKNRQITLTDFFKWAFDNKYLATSLTLPIIAVPKEEQEDKGNRPYTSEQLQSMIPFLAVPTTVRTKARKYPHRALYSGLFIAAAMLTGARKEELLQMKAEDIQTYNGCLCFTLFGLNTKNLQSKRAIPVHKILVSLGLLDYVAKLSPSEKLFPCNSETMREDLKGAQLKAGIFSKRNEYTFHSFRRCLYTRLGDFNCNAEIRNSITGHSNKAMARIYDEYTEERLPVMQKFLDMTYQKLDFTPLRSNIAAALARL